MKPAVFGSEIRWIALLLMAIVLAFTLRFPLNMIQAIACALHLGIKLGRRSRIKLNECA